MIKVRVRFAPSPTGFLHVGGLRTALFNFLFAKHNGGKFILRIEDTDKSREVAGATDNIVATLKDFGLNFDEGPVRQSDRLGTYKKYAEELISKGAAYKCYCSAERIEKLKAEAAAAKVPFKYDKKCLKELTPALSLEKRGSYVIRQNVPEEGSVEFEDLVHGKIRVENRTLDDGILLKSDSFPVYNLANVIDDHEMAISHVIRGEEFIPSTPKHILLYQAFGWSVPQFAHLPLILDKDRKKLSKRFGDVAVKEYVDKGYLREALLNFIAFLGWNPKNTQEIFSLEELTAAFDLAKVNRAGAVFDIEKLDFINREWQKKLKLGVKDSMFEKAKELLETKFHNAPQPPLSLRGGVGELLPAVWPLILERVKGPSELEEKLPEFYFFFAEPEYEAELLVWKDTPRSRIKENLEKIKAFLDSDISAPSGHLPSSASGGEKGREEILKAFLAKESIGIGEGLWPLRVALSGLKNSPGPFEIMQVLPKAIVLARVQAATKKL